MRLVDVHWTFVQEPVGEDDAFLSEAERRRLQGMRFPLRRQSFLLGRRAAKEVLRHHPACARLAPGQITVANLPEGAPYVLAGDAELPGSLSISHSRGAAVGALLLAPGFSVGIDLEAVEPRSRAFLFDFFTASEVDFISRLSEAEQDLWVNCIWSAKEAVLKATGTGLRMDSRSVAITPGGVLPEAGGWQKLAASCSRIAAESCRVYWMPLGSFVLTLAVLCRQAHSDHLTVRIHRGATVPCPAQEATA